LHRKQYLRGFIQTSIAQGKQHTVFTKPFYTGPFILTPLMDTNYNYKSINSDTGMASLGSSLP
jgi:hypothetical protein